MQKLLRRLSTRLQLKTLPLLPRRRLPRMPRMRPHKLLQLKLLA